MNAGMYDEDSADVRADRVLTGGGTFEGDLDSSDFADTDPGLVTMFPTSPGAPEFVGAYGRVYTRTDEIDHDGELIWQDEDGDYGTMEELKSAIGRAEAHEAMGGDTSF